MKMSTYVNFAGKCAEAFRYYEKHLGAKIDMMMTHGQAPDQNHVKPEWKDAVLHASVAIGGADLAGADIPNAEPMRSAYPTLNTEVERVFCSPLGRWPGTDEGARDILCDAIWPGPGSVRNKLDDPARTPDAAASMSSAPRNERG